MGQEKHDNFLETHGPKRPGIPFIFLNWSPWNWVPGAPIRNCLNNPEKVPKLLSRDERMHVLERERGPPPAIIVNAAPKKVSPVDDQVDALFLLSMNADDIAHGIPRHGPINMGPPRPPRGPPTRNVPRPPQCEPPTETAELLQLQQTPKLAANPEARPRLPPDPKPRPRLPPSTKPGTVRSTTTRGRSRSPPPPPWDKSLPPNERPSPRCPPRRALASSPPRPASPPPAKRRAPPKAKDARLGASGSLARRPRSNDPSSSSGASAPKSTVEGPSPTAPVSSREQVLFTLQSRLLTKTCRE